MWVWITLFLIVAGMTALVINLNVTGALLIISALVAMTLDIGKEGS